MAEWERQEFDQDEEFQAFVQYRDQMAPRRLRGLGPTAKVAMWYRDFNWQSRIAAYDTWIDSIFLKERAEALGRAAKKQAEDLALTLGDAHEFLNMELNKFLQSTKKHSDVNQLRPHEMVRLLEQVVKLKRLVAGESTENPGPGVDLSKLSLDELRALEALHRKLNEP